MKTISLTIIAIAGICSLVGFGVYIITNPIISEPTQLFPIFIVLMSNTILPVSSGQESFQQNLTPPALNVPIPPMPPKPLPLQQLKAGTLANNVRCNDDLVLVTKLEDGSPACVKTDSANILIERGWAINLGAEFLTPPEIRRLPLDHISLPRPLTMWGQQYSFEGAKSFTGLPWAYLPDFTPNGTMLQSVRGERDYNGNELITAIYAPVGVTALDNDTFEKVLSEGGIFIMYSHLSGSKANLTSAMNSVKKEFPSTPIDAINCHKALIFSNEIQINLHNNNMVDIVSWKYNSTELRPITVSVTAMLFPGFCDF